MKTFNLSWGSGIVAEEAQSSSEHRKPTIQLLEFTDGESRGARQIRFCSYTTNGAYSRFPLIIDTSDIPKLKREIKKCPTLHKLLARLV